MQCCGHVVVVEPPVTIVVVVVLDEVVVVDGFVVVVVGGLSSIPGALLAAFLIGLMQSVCGYVLDDAWAKIVTYALLYVVLVLRPQGLFGQKVET